MRREGLPSFALAFRQRGNIISDPGLGANMTVTMIVRLLIISVLALASFSAAADSISCDGGIVSVGDSRLDLFAKCGPPALRELEPVTTAANMDPSLVIERWTYNFGPNRFIQIVSLQGGKVISIERGSYGYPLPEPSKVPGSVQDSVPRARCEPDAFRIGDFTFDVLAKCGEPVYKDLRPKQGVTEVWTYDFGERTFVRLLEFTSGRLVRIRTGGYGYSK